MKTSAASVQAYLAKIPPAPRAALQRLRRIVRRVVPDADEQISYGIPVFKREKLIVGYAAWAKHCALYAISGSLLAKHQGALKGFECGKGTIRFTPGKPLPAALLKKLVKGRLAEIAGLR